MARLRVTMTRVMFVDVDEDQTRYGEKDEKGRPTADYVDICEAVDRWRRITAHGTQYVDAWVDVDQDEDAGGVGGTWGLDTVDGNGRQKFLWSARHFVIEARHELSLGRYREGHCPDLDRVNGLLAGIEDQLRLMALETDKLDAS